MPSKKISAVFLFLSAMAPLFCFPQTRRIDSLKNQVQMAAADKEKIAAILQLCKEQFSLNPDTVYKYAMAAKVLAVSQHDAVKTALADYYIGYQFLTRGMTDSSLTIADRNLKQLHYTTEEKEAYVDYILLKARTFNNLNRGKEALDLLYPLLATAEKQADTLTQMRTMNGMVSALVTAGDDKEAQRWCYKALQIYPPVGSFIYQEAYGVILSNLALTFMHLYEANQMKPALDSSVRYTDLAIASSSKNEFLGGLAYNLGLKAVILGINNKIPEGEQILKESLATYRQIGNMFYIINTMSVMGNFYGITKQPEKGIAICKEGIALCKKSEPNIYLYGNLAANYKLAGNYKAYGETLEQLSAIKDSLHFKNSALALFDVQTRYEMQKKENTIIEQNYALAKKNYLAYGSLALLLIGSVFFILLIRLNRNKQQFKFQTIQREEKRLNEIAVSTAEENERRRIAAELHDNLGGQLSYISSNMDFILEAPASLTEDEKKKHLSKVNETAKSTIADLRESIWALKKQQVEVDELADKIKLFAQSQLAHQVGMQLEVHENILHKTILSSAEALNIFRIFQEAINNALKYSDASKIILSIETSEIFLYHLSLEDDGTGFDTKGNFTDHYGLENMQQRSKDIRAALNITSISKQGSIVSLSKKPD
ncbi:MAG: histidine kinase [Bacteroidota bacterium]